VTRSNRLTCVTFCAAFVIGCGSRSSLSVDGAVAQAGSAGSVEGGVTGSGVGGQSGIAGAAAGAGGTAGTDGGATGGSAGTTSRVPLAHRAVATACPQTRPEPTCMHDAPGTRPVNGGNCNVDADCTAGTNGRCVASAPFAGICSVCSYDACTTDADCASVGTCDCRFDFQGANVCSPGNCRVDADCGAGGYCSPSRPTCLGYPEETSATLGFFCHTPNDTCANDDDCATSTQPRLCRYDGRAWRCFDFPGCPA
jgi:hypothetical protein